MAKTESTLKNMVLTLLIITCIAGGSLGFVYKLTKGPIDAAKAAKQETAIKVVLPEFDEVKKDDLVTTTNLFKATKNGELVGIAIEATSSKGFSGNVKIMVGFKPDGSIFNYQVLEHKETPGLGTKMADWFKQASEAKADEAEPKQSVMQWLFGIKPGSGGGNRSIIGKHPEKNKLTVSKDNGEVDAITAAT
ncbi:MAG: RnfABCDGE type electron transport complex subunit G, partial [Carboxylicivirga sp.]|nr:RnfABCDGE type electron transport complex subunit G [Carboxylicivirga sp.]